LRAGVEKIIWFAGFDGATPFQAWKWSLMSEAVKIETTKGYFLYPGDVVDAVDLVRKGSVKLRVTQMDLRFSPQKNRLWGLPR